MSMDIRIRFAAILSAALIATLTGCGGGSSSSAASSPASATAASTPGAPSAPIISGTPPASAVAGIKYIFHPTVDAAAAAPITFTATNLPAWAAFDATTGTLSGTPKATDVGVYANISIKASDAVTSTALAPFTIKVQVQAAALSAPVISGAPAGTVVVDASYSFRPTVTAYSGATLSFAVANAPAWAKFDPATGSLTGTPAANDVGTYAKIVITVTDGGGSAALAPFSIVVTSGSSTVATVTWTPPPPDPTAPAAKDLAGYRIYYGMTAAGMTHVAIVNDPTSTSYVIDNLSAGVWYFAVASYDADQSQSMLSPTVAVTL
jgi:hypothetical protein